MSQEALTPQPARPAAGEGEQERPLDAFGRLRAALASAVSGGPFGGVGCHYWTRPTLGVPADQLEVLGLVRIIRSRVPTCEEHGCAIIASCKERVVFAERGPGIGRRKFRLTPLGTQAAAEPAVLAEQIAEQPLARRILDALAGAPGGTSWPELYWRLLQPELDVLNETGQRTAPPLTRSAVRFYLDLLVAAGLASEDGVAGTVWLGRGTRGEGRVKATRSPLAPRPSPLVPR